MPKKQDIAVEMTERLEHTEYRGWDERDLVRYLLERYDIQLKTVPNKGKRS